MRLGRILLAFALAYVSAPACAGLVYDAPVVIDLAQGMAGGSVSYAHAHASQSVIECSFDGLRTGGCGAMDPAGAQVGCQFDVGSSLGASLLKNVRAIDGATHLFFRWRTDNGTNFCTDIGLIKGSEYLSEVVDPYTPGTRLTVDAAIGLISGALTSTRKYGNPNDFVHCEVWSSGYTACWARTPGNDAQCFTSESANPQFADSVRAMSDTARVEIRFDPATRACTTLRIWKGSHFTR